MWEHKLCGQKYKDFELMLIQVVLSYRIVFQSAASLKGKHYVYKCFEMFAKILVVSLIKMFVSSIQKNKCITSLCIVVNQKMLVSKKTWESM